MSFSFFVSTSTGGKSDYEVTRALVTVDDDESESLRTLKQYSLRIQQSFGL